jgi:hypothetical protein
LGQAFPLTDDEERKREDNVPRIAVGTENDAPIEIHYEDHGAAGRSY